MKTVAFNMSHDASICTCENGKIETYLEEERVSRLKQDSVPVNAFYKVFGNNTSAKDLSKYDFGFTGLRYWPVNDNANKRLDFEEEISAYINFVILKSMTRSDRHERESLAKEKFAGSVRYDEHHVFHAFSGFYNSGFDDAAILVVDGMGNPTTKESDMQEVASLYTLNYPADLKCWAKLETPKHHSEAMMSRDLHSDWPMGIGMAYSAIASYLGFGFLGAGKVMGLAPYGKEDENIKPFIDDNYGINSRLFYRTHDGCNFIPYDYLPKDWDYTKWDDDVQKIANLAYRLQKDFEKWMIYMIKQALEITGKKNIVISGGCSLNCVANYEYLKHIPEGVKLFVDPISNDSGTAIGLAKFLYYSKTGSMDKHPLETLYLGPE